MARSWLAPLTIALLLAAPLAMADDDDKEEGDESRKVELDVDDLKATIKLERELGDVEDSVKIEFDAEKAKVQVKHEKENATTETEQKLEARFRALVEYVDGDGDGAYDPGETIASAWALSHSEKDVKIPTDGTVEWDDITVTDVTSGNASGKKLASRASFGENATFGLDFFVYGDFTMVGNASLQPTEAKIDVIIQHYPYTRADSALAVIVDLKAAAEFEDERETDDEEEGVSSEAEEGNLTFRLTFTWLETATVDGVEQPVRSTILKERAESEDGEQTQKARVALSYVRGDVIVHDPTMGVTYGTQSSGASAVPLPAVGLVLVAVAAVAALARPRRQ